jgi:hypothetical protein
MPLTFSIFTNDMPLALNKAIAIVVFLFMRMTQHYTSNQTLLSHVPNTTNVDFTVKCLLTSP